jgi:hypothetical protein
MSDFYQGFLKEVTVNEVVAILGPIFATKTWGLTIIGLAVLVIAWRFQLTQSRGLKGLALILLAGGVPATYRLLVPFDLMKAVPFGQSVAIGILVIAALELLLRWWAGEKNRPPSSFTPARWDDSSRTLRFTPGETTPLFFRRP